MRIFHLDVSRGICVLAMIAYHFSWDLGYFGFIDLRVITQGLGLVIAQLIGVSFIIIAGISSRLLSLSHDFKVKFLKRSFKLISICIIISFATFMLDKNSFIFFGILHFLLVCSLLSLIMYKIRDTFKLLFIVFILGLVSASEITLNLPFMLSWLGFSKEVPIANDFYPLFPWITFYFFGFWLGEVIYIRLSKKSEKNSTVSLNRFLKFLDYVGQKSLVIYILHQPILFSLFFLFIKLISRN